MKLYLTKCHGGRYMLTYLRPIITQIRGTQTLDAFEELGEPVATKHLCEAGIKSLFGRTTPLLESFHVQVLGKIDPIRDKNYSLFYLTKCRSGLYIITALRPVASNVKGTNELDVFEKPGEPISVRHLCTLFVTSLFGDSVADLNVAQPIKVQLRAEFI